MVAITVAFAFTKAISGSFSSFDRKHALKVPVFFGAERIYLFLSFSAPQLSANRRMTDLKEESSPPSTVH